METTTLLTKICDYKNIDREVFGKALPSPCTRKAFTVSIFMANDETPAYNIHFATLAELGEYDEG